MSSWLARIALCMAAIPFVLSAHAGPVLRVGEVAPVRVGDSFSVPILIAAATDLKAFQFDLAYDPLVLEATGLSDTGSDFEAAALAGGGALTGLTGFALPGLLSGVADSMSGVADGLFGSGVLVTIEFRAIGLGRSGLALSNAFVDFLALDTAALVDGVAVVPGPGVLALALLALACLARQRRPKRRHAVVRRVTHETAGPFHWT